MMIITTIIIVIIIMIILLIRIKKEIHSNYIPAKFSLCAFLARLDESDKVCESDCGHTST